MICRQFQLPDIFSVTRHFARTATGLSVEFGKACNSRSRLWFSSSFRPRFRSQAWCGLGRRGGTAILDGAVWALSSFAVIPWLDVEVRFLGVGSLGAKGVDPGLTGCLRT